MLKCPQSLKLLNLSGRFLQPSSKNRDCVLERCAKKVQENEKILNVWCAHMGAVIHSDMNRELQRRLSKYSQKLSPELFNNSEYIRSLRDLGVRVQENRVTDLFKRSCSCLFCICKNM